MLTEAIVTDGPTSGAWRAAQRIAYDRGQAVGEQVRVQRRLGRLGPERALAMTGELLGTCGYEPVRAVAHQLVLSNCPFQSLAARARALVCALNRDFVAGLLCGLRAQRVNAVLHSAAATDRQRCCVLVQAPTHSNLLQRVAMAIHVKAALLTVHRNHQAGPKDRSPR